MHSLNSCCFTLGLGLDSLTRFCCCLAVFAYVSTDNFDLWSIIVFRNIGSVLAMGMWVVFKILPNVEDQFLTLRPDSWSSQTSSIWEQCPLDLTAAGNARFISFISTKMV